MSNHFAEKSPEEVLDWKILVLQTLQVLIIKISVLLFVCLSKEN